MFAEGFRVISQMTLLSRLNDNSDLHIFVFE